MDRVRGPGHRRRLIGPSGGIRPAGQQCRSLTGLVGDLERSALQGDDAFGRPQIASLNQTVGANPIIGDRDLNPPATTHPGHQHTAARSLRRGMCNQTGQRIAEGHRIGANRKVRLVQPIRTARDAWRQTRSGRRGPNGLPAPHPASRCFRHSQDHCDRRTRCCRGRSPPAVDCKAAPTRRPPRRPAPPVSRRSEAGRMRRPTMLTATCSLYTLHGCVTPSEFPQISSTLSDSPFRRLPR